jgi:hypothetical protein
MRTAAHSFHNSKKFSLGAMDQTTSDEQITRIIDAKAHLLDTFEVVKHHDGITETPKYQMADDYVYRIYKSTVATNPAYAERIDQIDNHAVIDADQWQWSLDLTELLLTVPLFNTLGNTTKL